jgi:hypothetical protein
MNKETLQKQLKLVNFLLDELRKGTKIRISTEQPVKESYINCGGLCTSIIMLHNHHSLISAVERIMLRDVIELIRPLDHDYVETLYWWKPGDEAPRIQALTELVGKLEKLIETS